MSAAVAALLIAVRLITPVCDPGSEPNVRAEVNVVCPSCKHRTWVTVKEAWCVPSAWVSVRDQCGREHFHDSGREYARFHCVTCCGEWSVEGPTGSPCYCGWEPGDDNSVLLEPCPSIDDEWTEP